MPRRASRRGAMPRGTPRWPLRDRASAAARSPGSSAAWPVSDRPPRARFKTPNGAIELVFGQKRGSEIAERARVARGDARPPRRRGPRRPPAPHEQRRPEVRLSRRAARIELGRLAQLGTASRSARSPGAPRPAPSALRDRAARARWPCEARKGVVGLAQNEQHPPELGMRRRERGVELRWPAGARRPPSRALGSWGRHCSRWRTLVFAMATRESPTSGAASLGASAALRGIGASAPHKVVGFVGGVARRERSVGRRAVAARERRRRGERPGEDAVDAAGFAARGTRPASPGERRRASGGRRRQRRASPKHAEAAHGPRRAARSAAAPSGPRTNAPASQRLRTPIQAPERSRA